MLRLLTFALPPHLGLKEIWSLGSKRSDRKRTQTFSLLHRGRHEAPHVFSGVWGFFHARPARQKNFESF